VIDAAGGNLLTFMVVELNRAADREIDAADREFDDE
jgi:hypothetical protein